MIAPNLQEISAQQDDVTMKRWSHYSTMSFSGSALPQHPAFPEKGDLPKPDSYIDGGRSRKS